jgi:hypothetical protein
VKQALTAFALLLAVLLTSACGYRSSSPGQLGEPLRVDVLGNKSRLVRSQLYLQQEVATLITRDLGWQVRPWADAALEMVIEEEAIEVLTKDEDDLPSKWGITLQVRCILYTSDRGVISGGPFTGTDFGKDRIEEPEALEDAANKVAAKITNWLEKQASNWEKQDRKKSGKKLPPPIWGEEP